MPRDAVLLVPVGSCEQHGPHLPLDTDTRIAQALADAAAEARSGVLVAPAIAIGASGEHRGFPGTLSIGTEVLCEVAVELARSATPMAGGPRRSMGGEEPTGFGGVLFVNAHGGNLRALELATRRLATEGRPAAVWHVRVEGGDLHAGRTETSLLLHLDGARVRTAAAAAGSSAPLREIAEQLRTEGVAAVSPNGVLGDPSGADSREGARLFDALLRDLLATLDRMG